MAEGCNQDLKRGLSRQFINMCLHKRLWDHFIQLQALIRSYTAHKNYEVDGKVPETCMTGQTDDISNIWEYSWYEWVIFCDKPITHPDLTVILRRYLWPPIHDGNAMTYKILKANGEYVCRTTVSFLSPTELACLEHKQLRNYFDASVAEALGPAVTISDFGFN